MPYRFGDDGFGAPRNFFPEHSLQPGDIVAVDMENLKTEGGKLRADIANVHNVSIGAVDLQAIVVDDGGEIVQPIMGSGHGGIPNETFIEFPSPSTAKTRLSRRFSLWLSEMPMETEKPCPREPVEASTPGRRFISGCPCKRLPRRRKVSSSSLASMPPSAKAA